MPSANYITSKLQRRDISMRGRFVILPLILLSGDIISSLPPHDTKTSRRELGLAPVPHMWAEVWV
jgi:hypothetical protein